MATSVATARGAAFQLVLNNPDFLCQDHRIVENFLFGRCARRGSNEVDRGSDVEDKERKKEEQAPFLQVHSYTLFCRPVLGPAGVEVLLYYIGETEK